MGGGDAALESKLGAGTTVRVRLPYAAVNTEPAAMSAEGDNAEDESNIIHFKGAA